MLLNKKLRLMGKLQSQKDIDYAKKEVLNDLYEKTYQLFKCAYKAAKQHKDDVLKTFNTLNYNIFSGHFQSKVTLNADNIVYQELIVKDVKEGINNWCKSNLLMKDVCSDTDQNIIKETQKMDQIFIEHCQQFYGKGQFPFVQLKIYKIGQHLYYAYNITR